MTSTTRSRRITALVLTTALAASALGGCTAKGGARADLSASRAQAALAKGKADKAVPQAEAAVAADPRNAAYRAMLGNAYLEAGRFESAVTSYNDAMSLGDNSSRTALSLSLAKVALGRQDEAVAVLDDWRDTIAPSDLGLAYALAGQADRGVMVLADALRAGENTAKLRQNLAYAYALAGRWAEARLMAAQDVSPDQIDDRISQWAQSTYMDAHRQRVATLLSVPASAADPGQPARLALSSSPASEQLAAEASAIAPRVAVAADGELPAESSAAEPAVELARYEAPVTTPPQSFEAAFATPPPQGAAPAAVMADVIRFVSAPVVQKLPARYGVAPAPSTVSAERGIATGGHLVQLGSFASEQGARRAWGLYTKRHQGLGNHELKVTQARVGGREYWRVAAAGFNGSSAQAMCAKVKRSSRDGCIAYKAGKPLPGSVS